MVRALNQYGAYQILTIFIVILTIFLHAIDYAMQDPARDAPQKRQGTLFFTFSPVAYHLICINIPLLLRSVLQVSILAQISCSSPYEYISYAAQY